MPVPILLVGLAAASGIYGAKKGLDAKGDLDAAESVNRRAQRIYEKAQQELDDKRNETQQALEELGQIKYEVLTNSIEPFVVAFEKIKRIDFDDSEIHGIENLPKPTLSDFSQMHDSVSWIRELTDGGTTALGSGGLAGLAAYGSVQMLASASTGTAISSLSGAAATNATLAWLGGGSIASGGLGIAGGTAVLGGIVAGPVLAVGGMMMASKAEVTKQQAFTSLDKAKLAVAEMEYASVAAEGIRKRATKMTSLLLELNKRFEPALSEFSQFVSHNSDYSSYSSTEKEEVFKVASFAITIKNILVTDFLDKDGCPTSESRKVVREGKRSLSV